jgi:thiol-disulfide isomerase/thioredoxin
MKPSNYKTAIVLIALLTAIPCFAQDNDPNSVKTVEQLYPNLAAGVLTYAKVEVMPEGILLKSEGVEISSKDIEKAIAEKPKKSRAELKKNAFFVLEQEATSKVLKKVASLQLSKEGKDINSMGDNQILQAFYEELTKDIKVTDKDVEIFYKENESIFCGTPLDKVRKQIESYVLQDKQQRFVDQYIQTLGQKMEIFVSAPWAKTQAQDAKDNPLDKSRTSGKPTLAIFSAKSCCGPDKMIPVRNALLKKYDTKINIVYIEPKKEQILAARYAIRSIPTQVFYDSKGREFFRHSGFFSEKDITDKLSEVGVQ